MKNNLNFLFMALVLSVSITVRATDINVFAAASLTDTLKTIGAAYQKTTGDKIIFNFGASSTLARQIEEGAPADIFFSAAEPKMDALEKRGLIDTRTRKTRLSNSLVIVVASEKVAAITSPKDLADPKIKRVALGDPKAVPIGIYAKEYLQKLGLWTAVEPKVVATENVRAALAAVEAGNADASIVYRTDAAIFKNVKIAYDVPRETGPKISYPMALVKASKNPEAALKFLAHLSSADSAKVFTQYGFIVADQSPPK